MREERTRAGLDSGEMPQSGPVRLSRRCTNDTKPELLSSLFFLFVIGKLCVVQHCCVGNTIAPRNGRDVLAIHVFCVTDGLSDRKRRVCAECVIRKDSHVALIQMSESHHHGNASLLTKRLLSCRDHPYRADVLLHVLLDMGEVV